MPWGLNLYIYQEILQGAKDIKEFNNLKKYFSTQRFYYLNDGKKSFEKASLISPVSSSSKKIAADPGSK